MEKASDFLTEVIKRRLKDFESGSFMHTVIVCPICGSGGVYLKKESDNWVFHCSHCEMFNYKLKVSNYKNAYDAIEACILKMREVRHERSENSNRS